MTDYDEILHLKVVGEVIRSARERILDDRTGKPISQAALYERFQKLEAPPPGKPARLFRRNHFDTKRTFVSDVEYGRQSLSVQQKRVVEKAFGWPDKTLDGVFRTTADFERRRDAMDRGAPLLYSESPPSKVAKKPIRSHALDVSGIRHLADGANGIPSRIHLNTEIQEGLLPAKAGGLRIVTVFGEGGVGKSQVIAEWWHSCGKKRFRRCVYTLDCSRLGGDEIVQKLTERFVDPASSSPKTALAEALDAQKDVLVVLDGLSSEEVDPTDWRMYGQKVTFRDRNDLLVSAGRTDHTALRAVWEMLVGLGKQGVRASFLLGIQTGPEAPDFSGIQRQLNASVDVKNVFVARLEPADGAHIMQQLGVEALSVADLKHLSARLQGLPISLVAAAHYLRQADPPQVEAFLANIDNRDRNFRYFEEFIGRYLDALSIGRFDPKAHPHAFLRLLALMPGPVPKLRLDELMASGNIKRLENGETSKFERMLIPFLVDQHENIDINPIVRSLLRHELDRGGDRVNQSGPTSKSELHWIHGSAASWYLGRLPTDTLNYSKIDVKTIEGTLYHLLALRDYVGHPPDKSPDWRVLGEHAFLLDPNIKTSDITRFCLQNIVYRYLISKHNSATRFLGQFETKARLLSLFVENLDDEGRPRHLTMEEQITIYTEIGICWMHAGRLQLAHQSLSQARARLDDLGVRADSFSQYVQVEEGKFDIWRAWTDTLNTQALIAMRLGRDRSMVEGIMRGAIDVAVRMAKDALAEAAALSSKRKTSLVSARRVICRYAHLCLSAGESTKAIEHFELAIALENAVSGSMISGDALRRYIEAIVRKGPCFDDDLKRAEKLIDDQIGQRATKGTRRRLSNDIIALYVTKAMILRAKGEFTRARELIENTEKHEFVVRGECTFVARVELAFERFRLEVALDNVTQEQRTEMELLLSELQTRHHLSMYRDALLILAEMKEEPERSDLLSKAESAFSWGGWRKRLTDLIVIREGGSAVQAMGC